MGEKRRRYDWLILNQSQSPEFQRMMSRLADELGSALLFTGTPFPEEGENLHVRRGAAYAYGGGLVRRAFSWLRFTFRAGLLAMRTPGRPFVLAVTNPPFLPHLAWSLRGLRKMRYGLLVWDIYPDHVIRQGWCRERGLLAKAWRALNRRAFRNAEVIITLGERMAGTLREQWGADARRDSLAVIPNWADCERFRPLPKAENPFVQRHGLAEKFTVLYAGNMGAAHGLEPVVEAAARLRECSGVAFLFIGDGLGRPAVEQALRQEKLDNVTLLERRSWEELPLALAAADVALVIQAPGTEHLSVPSKTYTALAAGCAVLALSGPHGDLAELVEKHQAGRVCPSGDPDRIAEAIRSLRRDPERLAAMRRNARRAAEEEFSSGAILEKLRDALGPLVRREPAS